MDERIELVNLRVEARGAKRALVDDVSLEVRAGELVALVGASGSGKTLTCRALVGMVDLHPGVVSGEMRVSLDGLHLAPYKTCLGKSSRDRDRAFAPIRGSVVGYLAQNARAALDPLFTVGRQVRASATLRGDGQSNPTPWLERAGFSHPDQVVSLYPHELSGGMAQRVVIAQALARGSQFLLADEPTTGLDPTVQAGILAELKRLRDEGMGILLVTHDLRILPSLADRILVMHEGQLVESLTPTALASGTVMTDQAQRLVDAVARIAPGALR
jgi:ABC-type glutathione transport system ATPase component